MNNKTVKLVAIQLCSTPDVEENIAIISTQLSGLTYDEQQLVLLPECCLFFGGQDKDQLTLAQQDKHNNILKVKLSALAKTFNVFLIAGSIPQLSKISQQDKFTNTCMVFTPDGNEVASYHKLHLFDVNLDDNEKNYLESRYVQAGQETIITKLAGVNVGLTICYDLRFPELFRQLCQQGAKIITVPSAFTKVTGKAHWQTLLQARAIENQVYIVAAGQEGKHANGRETWGHSMIISPWGEILAQKQTGHGMISAEYNEQELIRIRKSIPIAEHNRFKTKLIPYE